MWTSDGMKTNSDPDRRRLEKSGPEASQVYIYNIYIFIYTNCNLVWLTQWPETRIEPTTLQLYFTAFWLLLVSMFNSDEVFFSPASLGLIKESFKSMEMIFLYNRIIWSIREINCRYIFYFTKIFTKASYQF